MRVFPTPVAWSGRVGSHSRKSELSHAGSKDGIFTDLSGVGNNSVR